VTNAGDVTTVMRALIDGKEWLADIENMHPINYDSISGDTLII
jgi:hypothetical protein